MTPAEQKAKALIEKYKTVICKRYYDDSVSSELAKQCALIAQQNTIDTLEELKFKFDPLKLPHAYISTQIESEQEVKELIQDMK